MKNNWELLNKLDVATIVAVAPRPGTDFLHSLFDSHPQVLTFDGWLMFHRFYSSAISVYGTQNQIVDQVGTVLKNSFEKIDVTDFYYEFAWGHLHKFNSKYDTIEKKDKLGINRDEYNSVDIDEFVNHAVNLIGDNNFNSRNALLAVYGAYALSRGEDLQTKKILLDHVHLPEHIYPITNDFKNMKIIACTRDPRVYATKINMYQHFLPLTSMTIGTASAFFRLMLDNIEPLLDLKHVQIKVNILEKLHESPERTLKDICKWLEIDFDPILLKSTWNGKSWRGDEHSLKKIKNVFDKNRYYDAQKSWEKDLSTIDQIVVEKLMSAEMSACSYKKKYRSILWYILLPALILIPTKYELKLLKRIFREGAFSHYLKWVRILLHRYYYSYRKIMIIFLKINKGINNYFIN